MGTMTLLAAAILMLSLALHYVEASPSQLNIHTIQILVSHSVQNETIVTLSDLMEGLVYRVEHSSSLCPRDIIAVNETTGSLLFNQTITPTGELQCASNSTHYYPVVRTFLCFAIIETLYQSYDGAIAIHVIPSESSIGLQLSESVYSGIVSIGILEAPVNLNNTLAVTTLSGEVVLLPAYAIVAGNDINAFKIIHEQVNCYSFARLVTTVVLNTTALYNLTIQVTAPTHSDSAVATVMVYAVSYNQHTPQFIHPPTVVTVNESAPVGFLITQLLAVDLDSDPTSAMVHYALLQPHPQMVIDPLTGQVYLKQQLDYETANETSITVVAYDVGDPSLMSEVTITIFITDTYEYSPMIDIILHHSQVSEHLPQGSAVAKINVNDADSNDVYVTMTAAHCHSCFDLTDGLTLVNKTVQYDIVVAEKLDYELYPYGITLYITATNHNVPALSTTETVVINILDENEPPYFNNSDGVFRASIANLQPMKSHVTTVTALDEDTGNYGNLMYSIISGNENSWFTISPWTGVIEVMNSIHIALGNVNLTVSVQDTSDTPLSIEGHVIISIEDIDNNQPHFSDNLYQIVVSESINTTTPIFSFSASDDESSCSGAIEYSVMYAEPSVFVIDKVSGLLYISEEGALDYEQYTTAFVRVSAMSLGQHGDMFNETQLNITVTNENDNPPFITPIQCPCFVYEEDSMVQSCFSLSVIDPDGDSVMFSIASGNGNGMFAIDMDTGVVSTTGTLDREAVDTHTLTIVASDGVHSSVPVTLMIKVVDIDDNAPVYKEDMISLSPHQSLKPGDVVANVAAVDTDTGYNALVHHRFSDSTFSGVLETFRLDPLSGDLYLLKTMTKGDTYSFSVTAAALPNEANPVSVDVNIVVQGDENESPYFLRSYDKRIVPRNLDLSSTVVMVQAIDSNDDVILYDIIDNTSGVFSIDSASGTVSLASSLQDIIDSTITLNISANDSALIAYTTVQLTLYDTTITVGDVELTQSSAVGVCDYNGTVLENSNANQIVVELEAPQNGPSITYTLIDGEFKTSFEINGYTLQTKEESFDREEYQQLFLVLRAEYGNFFHYCSVTIDIVDINDNSPQFLQTLNTMEVYRTTPTDSSIFKFQATDSDTSSNALTSYMLTADNVPFIIEDTTGIVRTTGTLNGNSYTISVMAADSNNNMLNSTATLTITILSTSNTPPSFTKSLNLLEVAESHATKATLETIDASDEDRGMHADLFYCIQQGNYNDAFNTSNNGVLYLVKPLDYETFPTVINLTLMAHDNSPNPSSTSTVVQVTISNVNDETPQFLASTYFASVYENDIQQVVATVTAVDRDSGGYGEVEYSIVTTDNRFNIDSNTGTIRTGTEIIDREQSGDIVTLTVMASDGNGKNTSATIDITIRDRNEHRPVFNHSSHTVEIMESHQVGNVIYMVETTDYDSGINGAVIVWIADGNVDGLFFLNGQTGALSLATAIDYEAHTGPYNLTVQAKDLGGLDGVSTTNIIIHISDVNDNSPTFTHSLYQCTISEAANAPITLVDSATLCQVAATDADITGNAVSYSIVSGSGFTIDDTTGVLTVNTDIDYETISQYVLCVAATDSGIPASTSTAVVIISVIDENDHQTRFDSHPTHIYVPETVPVGTELFRAYASDADEIEEAISYTLITLTDEFTIDSESGIITTMAQLEFNRVSSHSISILAKSNSGDTIIKAYDISILNVDKNAGPPELSPNTPALVEAHATADHGTHIATISATTQHRTVHYYITGGSGYGYFTINNSTGAITVAQSLVPLTDTIVALNVTVLDDDAFPTPIVHTLTVVVTEDMHQIKPFFTNPVFEMSVSEAVSTNHIIGHVLALVNGRIGNDTCYSLWSEGIALPFSVNATTGAIVVNGSLNRELVSSYQFHVEASGNLSIALVNIAILDINNYSPQIVSQFQSISIPLSFPVGLNHTIVRLFTIDKDVGDNAKSTYTLEPVSSPFSIDTISGEIYLNSSLANGQYNVTVMVDNGDLTTMTVPLTITTYTHSTGPNNAPPSFPSPEDSLLLSESTEVGSIVCTTMATDTDGDSIFYSISKTPYLSYEKFSIHPTTGDIYLTSPLDREEQDSYGVTVEAWDGQNITTLVLAINITDINDNPQRFTSPSFVFNVTESSSVGTQIGTLTVEDNDSTANLLFVFAIVDSLPPINHSLFGITDDGVVVLNRSLDRESISQYQLTVSVYDGVSEDFTHVRIQVQDIDDNVPMLVGLLPTLYVYENASIGSHIYTVTGYDPDLDQGSTTDYLLLNASLPFSVDEATGKILSTAVIDYEATSEYTLELLLYNRYNPLSNSTVLLIVQVLNVIDTFPDIPSPEAIQISENLPQNTFVVAISSTSHPHPLTYSIISGNGDGYFYLESISGIIRTTVPLDYETQSQYVLTIRGAYDGSYYSDVNVTIDVVDVNDNAPTTTSTSLVFEVSEGEAKDTEVVFQIFFTDRDNGINGEISNVTIVDSHAASTFSIATSGEAMLTSTLDRETQDLYEFQIIVQDGGVSPQYTILNVVVIVIDVNDNAPVFLQDSYEISVSAPLDITQPVLTVEAKDADKNSKVIYSISSGNEDNIFTLDQELGEIRVINLYDIKSVYILSLAATDEGGLVGEAVTIVTVKYCNFNSLSFQPSFISLHVQEDIAIETSVIELIVNDFGTPAGQLHYYLPVPLQHFDINSTTGEIFVSSKLDREQDPSHEFVVQVQDTASPNPRLAEARIQILLQDSNDNAPLFLNTPYVKFVVDDTPVGAQIFRVASIDIDEGPNSSVWYSLATNPYESFAIDSISGVVTLLKALVPDSGTHIDVVILASDRGSPVLSSNVTLRLNVINSAAPNFSQPIYTAIVSESTPVDSVVIQVVATTNNEDNTIFYSIVDTNDPKFPFTISPASGNITVNDRGLDYETVQQYDYYVLADDTITGYSSQVQVQITISDYNDELPVFTKALYVQDIDEDVGIDTTVVIVSANDEDSFPNAQLIYFLATDPDAASFQIDPTHGRISTVNNLDYENKTLYEFTVYANDSGTPSLQGSSTIRIVVNNINDNPPQITNSDAVLTVSELAMPNTVVGFVIATDPDDDDITYSLVSNVASENFTISLDGRLSVANIDDVVLRDASYIVTVQVSDDSFNTLGNVTIDVIDVNDHSPIFQQQTYYSEIVENPPAGVYITTILATDDDRGTNAQIQYSGNLDQFSVDEDTGVIMSACNDGNSNCIDREAFEVYSLNVIARDGGGRTDTATVLITVLDVNDNTPAFTQDEFIAFVEEGTVEGLVLTVTALDPDEGTNGTLTFDIVGSADLPFALSSDSGDITVTGSLDYDTKSSYQFSVTATDGGGLTSAPAVVLINLTNIADSNPKFLNAPYFTSIPEHSSINAPVFTVNVSYSEGCFGNGFSIISANVPFKIDNDHGIISVAGTLDREVKDEYIFSIQVECIIFPIELRYAYATVTITISDVNENPKFGVNFFSAMTLESVPINTTITEDPVLASDNDIGNNSIVRYRILPSSDAPFGIEDDTGVIYVSGPIDRESMDDSFFFFTVEAYDLGTPSLTDSYTAVIEIVDVNDSPPMFVCDFGTPCMYEISIPEDTPLNTSIATLATEDADSNSHINFSLNVVLFNVFTTGQAANIYTATMIDYESISYYAIDIIASDGIFTTSAELMINITDVNDNQPIFTETEYEVSIPEMYPTGETFTSVLAIDADDGDNAIVTYSILSSPEAANVSLNETTGEVQFIVSPDYETSSRLELHIQAVDVGGLEDFTFLLINIVDINDNRPVFTTTNYSASIVENGTSDTVLLYTIATDKDSENNGLVSYYLHEDSQEYFKISLSSGLITTTKAIDREQTPFIQLVVIARDAGVVSLSGEATVTVEVEDINDNAPVFEKNSYVAHISESTPVGATVMDIYVSDADQGSNANLIFDLTGSNHDDFSHESMAGGLRIKVANTLNHESISRYQLALRAIDGGFPSQEDTVSIIISIGDENDNQPRFDFPSYQATLDENVNIGTPVRTVHATDLDTDDANLIYFFKESQDDFFINSSTGDITVKASLDYESTTSYTITVVAEEPRLIPQNDEAVITITINDVNDNPPQFLCPASHDACHVWSTTIIENKPPHEIVDLNATDIDTVSNDNAITFKIVSGNDKELFSVDEIFGKLSTTDILDREESSEHILVIGATDEGGLTGFINITISVGDINDNAPQPSVQYIFVYLYNSQLGQQYIGRIAYTDRDLYNNHSYAITSTNVLQLSVVDDGLIVAPLTITPGAHSLDILISDILYNGTVVSSVNTLNVVVSNVDDVIVKSSFVVVMESLNYELFIQEYLHPFHNKVLEILSEYHSIDLLYIFSIRSSDIIENSTELTLAALLTADSYLQPDLFQHYLYSHRNILEDALNLSIYTEDLTYCSEEPCSVNGECSTVKSYSIQSVVIGMNGTASYLGLEPSIGAACTCAPGYAGSTCSDAIVHCGLFDCQNGAKCVDTPEVIGCACPGGYIGENCSIPYPPTDLCATITCFNGGTCTHSHTGFTCTCPTGFTGMYCNISTADNSGCLSNPCLYGGVCMWSDASQVEYSCDCPAEYSGLHCQQLIYDTNTQCEDCTCVYSIEGTTTCLPSTTSCAVVNCREPYYCSEVEGRAMCVDDCSPNPCFHDGVCVAQQPGHYCVCPIGYNGPNCELTAATFTPTTQALFPSLPPHGEIMLNIITENEDSLLLYSGLFDRDGDDYIMLSVTQGHVQCNISYGGAQYQLTAENVVVSNQRWYTISLIYNTEDISLSVINYENNEFDHVSEPVSVYHHLDVTTPLVMGSHASQYTSGPSFVGCVENLIINDQYLDFTDTLLQTDLNRGCTYTGANCIPNPCNNSGICRGSWDSYRCTCSNSYGGVTCDNEAESGSFTGDSYIQYLIKPPISIGKRWAARQVLDIHSTAITDITLGFFTTTPTATLIQLGVNDGDYAILEINNGLIQFRYNLGSGERLLVIKNRRVDDDVFHNVSLSRQAYNAELVLDTIYVATESTVVAAADPTNAILLDIASDMVYLGASVSRSQTTGYFVGCIQGMTLNGHDLPANGETDVYQAMPSNGRLVQPCDKSNRGRNDEPTSFLAIFDTLYILCGVVLVGLIAISCVSVICCKCLHHCYIRRRGKLEIQNRSNTSANSFRFSSRNPHTSLPVSRSGIQCSNSFEPVDLTPQISFAQIRSSTPSLEPPAIAAAAQLSLPSKKETVQQPMPSPVRPVHHLDPMTGMPVHQRTQSNVTNSSADVSNTEMKKYILSKKEFADKVMCEMNHDEVHIFGECEAEDIYEPLSSRSVESLYDIVNRLDDEDEPRMTKMEPKVTRVKIKKDTTHVDVGKPLVSSDKVVQASGPKIVLSKKKKSPTKHKTPLKQSNLNDTKKLLSYTDCTDGKLVQELQSFGKKPSKLTGETASASPLSIHETWLV